MDPTLALSVATWTWIVVGLALHAFLVAFAFSSRNDTDELPTHFVLMLMGIAGTGVLVSSLGLAGLAVYALWAWRISAAVLVITAVWSQPRSPVSLSIRAAATGNFIVGALIAVLGFASGPVTVRHAPVIAPGPAPTQQLAESAHALRTAPIMDGVWFWHFIALGMLAAGTIVFIVLFVRVLERGVNLQVESHWGGIGGGLGGWRVSSSLTYLAMAAVFGILFAVFVLKLEPTPPKVTPPPAQTAEAAKKPAEPAPDAKAPTPDKAR
jgi:hypothetical protein